jgi:hypothetical protein
MKNIKQDCEDTLRPEYQRSDFGEMVKGKYAYAEFKFADIARAFVVCIGEDEGLSFTLHSQGDGHKSGDWTYEIDDADQITLRHWLSEFSSVEEPVSNPPYVVVTTPQERAELETLLRNHVRALKAKVAAL